MCGLCKVQCLLWIRFYFLAHAHSIMHFQLVSNTWTSVLQRYCTVIIVTFIKRYFALKTGKEKTTHLYNKCKYYNIDTGVSYGALLVIYFHLSVNLIYKKCVHVITVHSCKYVSVLYKFFNKTSVSPERSSWACIFLKVERNAQLFFLARSV